MALDEQLKIDGNLIPDGSAGDEPRVTRERVFRWWDYLIYAPLMAVNIGVIAWFLLSWSRLADAGAAAAPFWIITFLLSYNFAIVLFRWLILPLMSRPRRLRTSRQWKVAVATTFVPGLESFAMLEKTVEALVRMDFPHETWVLDEGDNEKVKDLCSRLGASHFSRKGKPQYLTDGGAFENKTKHGNYNAWLDAVGFARYDVIVSFDPDHVPDREFLDASLGYLDDPSIGYVQFPQVYYNQSAGLVARGAAEETYAYYSVIQMSSYSFGFPIVTGCHTIHRTEALKEVGGFPAHDADDLLITLLYRSKGWQGVYVPEIRAKGLTPTDWPGYLTQQWRWARSVLDVKLRAFPRLAGRLPFGTRLMGFLHGLYYVQEGLIGLASVLFLVLMFATGVTPKFLTPEVVLDYLIVGTVLTFSDMYRQRFFLDSRNEWGFHIRAAFLRFVKWPYIFFGLIDAISGRKRPYSLTAKVKTAKTTLMTWPHLVVFGVVALAWVIGLALGREVHPLLAVAGGIALVSALLAVWTEMWESPEPFDIRIWRAEFDQGRGSSTLSARTKKRATTSALGVSQR